MTEKPSDSQFMTFEGYPYQRSRKDRKELRGTLLFFDLTGNRVVQKIPGFPVIKRVYRLARGIDRLFGGYPFWAEEKLDGYNARIFQHQGKIFGTTRGGFICPFTTQWARLWYQDFDMEKFFMDYPEHALCGEITGDTPYNSQRDPDLPPGPKFSVFEIVSPEGRFLPPPERYRTLESCSIPGVPVFGQYTRTRMNDLRALLLDLNERNREGVVLKDLKGQRRLKFVTATSDMADLEDALKIGFDMDTGYLFNRYLRACMFIRDFGLDTDDYAKRLGQAFLNGIPGPEDFAEASETYVIHVQEKSTWHALKDILATRVNVKTDDIRPVRIGAREMLRVRFRRIYQKSSHRYRRILKGHLHQD